MRWLKGNLHTHTDLSDGDSSPGHVARWYDDNGYDFLVISDHNLRFDPRGLQHELLAEGRRLLLIPGEELSTWWPGPDRTYALHVNGYGTSSTLGDSEGATVGAVLQNMVGRVVDDGGLASINHPNFWESVRWQEIAALERLTFLELYNGHHLAANDGTASQPPMEQVWDLVLASGRRVWGLAVDDAHHFTEFGADRANPGRGWVKVRSAGADTESILGALALGDFYASTGANLTHVDDSAGALEVVVDRPSQIDFIAQGEVIESLRAEDGSISLQAGSYVRARVENEAGVAWTQPSWE